MHLNNQVIGKRCKYYNTSRFIYFQPWWA